MQTCYGTRTLHFSARHCLRWSRRKSTAARPGKLGDPSMTLLTEPRMNQAMLEHLKPELLLGYGVVGKPIPFLVGPDSPLFLQHKWTDFIEQFITPNVITAEKTRMADVSGIEQRTETIIGTDGNSIELFIATPKGSGPAPGLLHMHGGAMTFMSTNDLMYRNYRAFLASRGFVVVSVEFRNASGKLGPHPYPAGLTDCMSALAWTDANRERLGISKLVLHGESGGGNLCSAMAIRAKQEGRLSEFDGVYAMCPFIAGPKVWSAKALPSLQECEGYFIDMKAFLVCARLYDPELRSLDDPCAWPLVAKPADLGGLPPHMISVNELDPLRDEGLAYCENLKGAGVSSESRVVKGTPHGGEFWCSNVPGCEPIFDETLDSIMAFAESL
mmetsp:Transcript_33263/g.84686  ORF Transcript_33263/g.84686 Transcript_33263/m.84686 type:complete len:386 (-) Transcript_33263:66-1223(-)